MKRLASAVTVLALWGCPDWDQARVDRCRALGETTGTCEGVVLDGGPSGGGTATGGGSATDAGRTFPQFAPSAVLRTIGSSPARTPRFLTEIPVATGRAVMVYESGATSGFSAWREGDPNAYGTGPNVWVAAAAHRLSSGVGEVDVYNGTTYARGVDQLSAQYTSSSAGLLDARPDALVQFVDGGSAFFAISSNGSQVFINRHCVGCTVSRASVVGSRVDEAVVDSLERTWVTGVFGANNTLWMQVPADLGNGGSVTFDPISRGPINRVQLAVSGTTVTAAWLQNGGLTFDHLDGTPAAQVPLEAGVTLVDLVAGPNSVVAVLTGAGDRNALLLHEPSGDVFFELSTPYRFRPAMAHLGTKLRIIGQCLFADGGVGGGSSEQCPVGLTSMNNPVLEFPLKPDGGPW